MYVRVCAVEGSVGLCRQPMGRPAEPGGNLPFSCHILQVVRCPPHAATMCCYSVPRAVGEANGGTVMCHQAMAKWRLWGGRPQVDEV